MVSTQVFTDSEKSKIKNKLTEYANLDGNLTSYVFEEMMSDGDVEIRFFPTPRNGPAEGIYFEIKVSEDADWYEELGAYRSDNLRNGNDIYEQFASELESCVQESLGVNPDFVIEKGSSAFTAEVNV